MGAGFLTKYILAVLLIGVIARAIVSVVLTHTYDLSCWAEINGNIMAGFGLYSVEGYYYTPIWGYFISAVCFIGNQFFGIPIMVNQYDGLIMLDYAGTPTTSMIPTMAFLLLMKASMIIIDFLVGYIVYKIVIQRTGSQRKAEIAFALWFLCPLTILISSVPAMFETLALFFLLVAVYMIQKEKYFLAGAAFVISVFTKFFPGYLIILLILFIVTQKGIDRKVGYRGLLIAACGGVSALLLIYWPQMMDGTIIESLSFVISRIGGESGDGIGFHMLIQPILFAVLLYVGYRFYKLPADVADRNQMKYILISLAIVFMIPYGPVQYYLLMIPFLAIASVMYDRNYSILMIAMSLLLGYAYLGAAGFTMLIPFSELTGWISIDFILSSAHSVSSFTYFIQGIGIACIWGVVVVFAGIRRGGTKSIETT